MAIDVEQIRHLVEMMVESDLSRIELKDGDTHILLRRGQPVVAGAVPAAAVGMAQALSPPSVVPAAVAPAAAPPTSNTEEVLIRSPMVGTFYTAAEPGAAPFVQVGSIVGPESPVCLIEAMKVFNEIKAETAGTITRVLVKNAEAVEYDQPLFAVAPA